MSTKDGGALVEARANTFGAAYSTENGQVIRGVVAATWKQRFRQKLRRQSTILLQIERQHSRCSHKRNHSNELPTIAEEDIDEERYINPRLAKQQQRRQQWQRWDKLTEEEPAALGHRQVIIEDITGKTKEEEEDTRQSIKHEHVKPDLTNRRVGLQCERVEMPKHLNWEKVGSNMALEHEKVAKSKYLGYEVAETRKQRQRNLEDILKQFQLVMEEAVKCHKAEMEDLAEDRARSAWKKRMTPALNQYRVEHGRDR